MNPNDTMLCKIIQLYFAKHYTPQWAFFRDYAEKRHLRTTLND